MENDRFFNKMAVDPFIRVNSRFCLKDISLFWKNIKYV